MSVSRYTVVRYVPDPLREEYINIGVIVARDDGSYVNCRFMQSWRRARFFGDEDTGYLSSFAESVYQYVDAQLNLFEHGRLDIARLQGMVVNWQNSIQFSELRASVAADPAQLLETLYARYVVERHQHSRTYRDKRVILSEAQKELRTALQARLHDDAPHVLREGYIEGVTMPHQLDLVISNGVPRMGVEALSFETAASSELENAILSTAYKVLDIKQRTPDLPFSILIIPPTKPRIDYQHALQAYHHAGAEVVEEHRLPDWVAATADSLAHLAG